MDPGAPTVADLVRGLCRTVHPSCSERHVHYALRVLGSRLGQGVDRDEVRVVEAVKRQLVRSGDDGVVAAARVSSLVQRLQGISILQQRWAVLHVLLSLSRDPGPSRPFASAVGSVAPLAPASSPAPPTPPAPAPLPPSLIPGSEATPTRSGERGKAPAWGAMRFNVPGAADFPASEQLLLRDVIYCLQGIDGRFVRFDARSERFSLHVEAPVPAPAAAMLRALCETGWTFRRVCARVEERAADPGAGAVSQRFCHAMQEELREYYRLLAVLEAQLNKDAAHHDKDITLARLRMQGAAHVDRPTPQRRMQAASFSAPAGSGLPPAPGTQPSPSQFALTLRRLLVWMREPSERMRLMAQVADAVRGLRGGALITALQAHAAHGDALVAGFARRLLHHATVPFYETLRAWIVEGELVDPHHEFFVREDAGAESGEALWRGKYALDGRHVPSFLPATLARKVVQGGKSINFIRRGCRDASWTMDPRAASLASAEALQYGSEGAVRAAVEGCAACANSALLDILRRRFHLMEHLRALNRYLLHGQGDFLQYLLDRLSPELEKPASKLYKHSVLAVVDAAVHGSNAQFERADVLDRLGVRLLQAAEGDTGWDVFSLDYRMESPLTAIVTPAAMDSYLRAFNFLWRLKRVGHALSSTWTRHMAASRTLASLPGMPAVLHRCQLLRQEMAHCVTTVAAYVLVGVIDTAWNGLCDRLTRADSLDDVIDAHTAYLDTINERALLAPSRRNAMQRVRALLDVVLRFCTSQHELMRAADVELERMQLHARRIEQRTRKGQWGTTDDAEETVGSVAVRAAVATLCKSAGASVEALAAAYRAAFADLLDSLRAVPVSDEALRDLLSRLDFNGFYARNAADAMA